MLSWKDPRKILFQYFFLLSSVANSPWSFLAWIPLQSLLCHNMAFFLWVSVSLFHLPKGHQSYWIGAYPI